MKTVTVEIERSGRGRHVRFSAQLLVNGHVVDSRAYAGKDRATAEAFAAQWKIKTEADAEKIRAYMAEAVDLAEEGIKAAQARLAEAEREKAEILAAFGEAK